MLGLPPPAPSPHPCCFILPPGSCFSHPHTAPSLFSTVRWRYLASRGSQTPVLCCRSAGCLLLLWLLPSPPDPLPPRARKHARPRGVVSDGATRGAATAFPSLTCRPLCSLDVADLRHGFQLFTNQAAFPSPSKLEDTPLPCLSPDPHPAPASFPPCRPLGTNSLPSRCSPGPDQGEALGLI